MNHTKQNMALAAEKRQCVINYINEAGAAGWGDIMRHCDLTRGSMPRLLKSLQEENIICYIGTAHDAGRKDLKPDVHIYAPYGTPYLTRLPKPREKPARYRGEKAPKHYHNWQTPEMTVEAYDLYAGRNLAMLAR